MMGIIHFENGKNRTVKYVDTGILINGIHSSVTNGVSVIRTWQVPTGKKWTLSNIHLSRDEPGAIDCYIEEPGGTGVKIGQDVAGYDIFIQKNFTIGGLWKLYCRFHASALPGDMRVQYLYNEEVE